MAKTIEKYSFVPYDALSDDEISCDVCIPEGSPLSVGEDMPAAVSIEENILLAELKFMGGKWEVAVVFGIKGTREEIGRVLDEIVEIAKNKFPTKEAFWKELKSYKAREKRREREKEKRYRKAFTRLP